MTARPSVAEKKHVIPAPPSQIEQVSKLTKRKAEEFHFSLFRQLYSQNGVPFIYASADDTYQSIALSNNLFLKELLKFNDLKEDVDIVPGTVVYLQKKRNQATKGLEMHVIERGETLRGISQRYGVRLKSLMKINSIKDADMIREGDIIKLRK
jgi:membrane-bound lytic murein transglycosylase D